jgi:hypothetical protein
MNTDEERLAARKPSVMKRVTRNVDPRELQDLLERPPRAYLAFNDSGAIGAIPVTFRFSNGRYRIGISSRSASQTPRLGQAVTLLIDDGQYYFELRAIKIRGVTAATDRIPQGAVSDLNWMEVLAEKVVAWNYGRMREV